jgi:hypothetical protein
MCYAEQETSYRVGAGGERIPLVPPSARSSFWSIHVPVISRAGIGCITSRRSPELDFWSLAALKAGCTVEEAKRRAQS